MVPLSSSLQAFIGSVFTAAVIIWVTLMAMWWFGGWVGTLWPSAGRQQDEDDE
jgi:hypothetical protein